MQAARPSADSTATNLQLAHKAKEVMHRTHKTSLTNCFLTRHRVVQGGHCRSLTDGDLRTLSSSDGPNESTKTAQYPSSTYMYLYLHDEVQPSINVVYTQTAGKISLQNGA
jgi:hypothetical protein